MTVVSVFADSSFPVVAMFFIDVSSFVNLIFYIINIFVLGAIDYAGLRWFPFFEIVRLVAVKVRE